MAKIVLLLAAALALLCLSSGAFCCEGTARVGLGGRLMVRAGPRAVIMAAHNYRPGRCYFQLAVHRVI